MNSLGVSRGLRKRKPDQPYSPVSPIVAGNKGYKVQHILGISEAEVSRVRSRSISSTSTARPQGSTFSEATTAPVASSYESEASPTLSQTRQLRSKANSTLLRGDDIELVPAMNGVGSVSMLKSRTSSSTLHSHYDPKKAPLSVSQQTSESSSRDFALRKGAASALSSINREMEHARQILFFKSSRSKKDGKGSPREHEKPGLKLKINPSVTRKLSKINLRSATPTSPSSVASVPSSPLPTTPARKLLAGLSRSASQQKHAPVVNSLADSPYAKIHIRRTKPGTRYWFDEVDIDSSDEETNEEPAVQQQFVSEVERLSSGELVIQGIADDAPVTRSGRKSTSTPRTRNQRPSSLRHSLPPGPPPPQELPATPGSPRVVAAQSEDGGSARSRRSKTTTNPLARANLHKQSILNLSSSDDEEFALGSSQSAPSRPAPREPNVPMPKSMDRADGVCDQAVASDIISLARSITNVARSSSRSSRQTKALSAATPTPPRATSRVNQRASQIPLDDEAGSDSDIISSFPATPTDTGSIRTSIRSSVLSDSGSLRSIRPMMVTKQEEKLLAAMRLKRAAMRQAERESLQRDTDRRGALRMLEAGQQYAHAHAQAQSPKYSLYPSGQDRHDHEPSNKSVSRPSRATQDSFDDYRTITATADARGSGTTFDTSVYSRRGSQATIRTNFSEESQYVAPSLGQSTPVAQHRPHRHSSRDTYLSLASDSSSYKRDSHAVTLQCLEEAAERDTIPSQLFMEPPFTGWDRAAIRAAH